MTIVPEVQLATGPVPGAPEVPAEECVCAEYSAVEAAPVPKPGPLDTRVEAPVLPCPEPRRQWQIDLPVVQSIWDQVGPLTPFYCPHPLTSSPADCIFAAPFDMDFSQFNFAGKSTFVNVSQQRLCHTRGRHERSSWYTVS